MLMKPPFSLYFAAPFLLCEQIFLSVGLLPCNKVVPVSGIRVVAFVPRANKQGQQHQNCEDINTDGRMDGLTDRRTDGLMDGWTDGLTD